MDDLSSFDLQWQQCDGVLLSCQIHQVRISGHVEQLFHIGWHKLPPNSLLLFVAEQLCLLLTDSNDIHQCVARAYTALVGWQLYAGTG